MKYCNQAYDEHVAVVFLNQCDATFSTQFSFYNVKEDGTYIYHCYSEVSTITVWIRFMFHSCYMLLFLRRVALIVFNSRFFSFLKYVNQLNVFMKCNAYSINYINIWSTKLRKVTGICIDVLLRPVIWHMTWLIVESLTAYSQVEILCNNSVLTGSQLSSPAVS
jgi:hypothetical protein